MSFQSLLHPSEIGAAAIEYALLGMLLVVAIAGAVTLTGSSLAGLYRVVCSTVSTATGGGTC